MMKNCIRCDTAHAKCVIIGDNSSCIRCAKMHFPCVFRASLRVGTAAAPSLSSSSSSFLPLLPQPPTPIMPKWSHTFATQTNSSDRVRAASVAFLAKHKSNGTNKNARLSDVYYKKASKQEKYLSVVHASGIDAVLLSAEEIRKEVIVFDGTASHPPPPISSPPDVSIVIIIIIIIIYYSPVR